MRFLLFSCNHDNKNCDVSISKISSWAKINILTEAQKYCNLLKITNQLASVGSEHGLKTSDVIHLMEKVLENWQVGREVETITKAGKDIPEREEEKIFTTIK